MKARAGDCLLDPYMRHNIFPHCSLLLSLFNYPQKKLVKYCPSDEDDLTLGEVLSEVE